MIADQPGPTRVGGKTTVKSLQPKIGYEESGIFKFGRAPEKYLEARARVFETVTLQVRFVLTDERLVVERWYERGMPEPGRVGSRHQANHLSEVASPRMG